MNRRIREERKLVTFAYLHAIEGRKLQLVADGFRGLPELRASCVAAGLAPAELSSWAAREARYGGHQCLQCGTWGHRDFINQCPRKVVAGRDELEVLSSLEDKSDEDLN